MSEPTEIETDGGQEQKPMESEVTGLTLDEGARVNLPGRMALTAPPKDLGVALTDELARILTKSELNTFARSNGLAAIDIGYVHEMVSRGHMVDRVGLTKLSKGQCLATGQWIAESVNVLVKDLKSCKTPEESAAIGKVIGGLANEMTRLVVAQTGIEKQQVDSKPKTIIARPPPPIRPGEIMGPVNVQVNIDNVKKEPEAKT